MKPITFLAGLVLPLCFSAGSAVSLTVPPADLLVIQPLNANPPQAIYSALIQTAETKPQPKPKPKPKPSGDDEKEEELGEDDC
jgi:hypothetical protein